MEQNLDPIVKAFHAAHESSYEFRQNNEPIEFVSLRVYLAGILEKPRWPNCPNVRGASLS